MTRVIAVSGAKHVGSTMLVNIVSQILKHVGKKQHIYYATSGQYTSTKRKDSDDYMVIKMHRFSPGLLNDADLVFTPIRDVRDVAISAWKRAKAPREIQGQINNMKKNIGFFNSWASEKTVIFKYEKYKENPANGVEFVAVQLGYELDPKACQNIADYVENLINTPKKGALMSPANITSKGAINKWEKLYTPTEKQQVLEDETVHNYLVKYGYHIDS